MKLSDLSRFSREALGTLLWSESDIDEDGNGVPFLDYAPGTRYESGADVPCEDFEWDESGLDEFSRDCEGFLSDVIEAGLSHVLPADALASDFVLTRNGHGAGFWDRGLGADGNKLTRMAKTYGTVGLYRGDDMKLYFHS